MVNKIVMMNMQGLRPNFSLGLLVITVSIEGSVGSSAYPQCTDPLRYDVSCRVYRRPGRHMLSRYSITSANLVTHEADEAGICLWRESVDGQHILRAASGLLVESLRQ